MVTYLIGIIAHGVAPLVVLVETVLVLIVPSIKHLRHHSSVAFLELIDSGMAGLVDEPHSARSAQTIGSEGHVVRLLAAHVVQHLLVPILGKVVRVHQFAERVVEVESSSTNADSELVFWEWKASG